MSDDAANGAAEGDEIIRLSDVYKIFGPQPRGRAFELARSGVPKNDVQRLSGHVVGLTDVNFSVNRGEIFVVMGLSGSGKSTAIRMVNKLHDVTHGEVLVDGVDVQKLHCRWSDSLRSPITGPPSSPAACSSASASLVHWPPIRTSSSWTRRSARSTRSSGVRCKTR